MEAPAEEIEYLANEVITNSKSISYRAFSRSLSIPLVRAKTTLYEFYRKNKDTLSASFVICGVDQNGTKCVKYCQDEYMIDHSMRQFSEISTVHVYGVQKKDLMFTLNDIALEELKIRSHLSKIAEYEKNGIIIGPKISEAAVHDIPVSSPIKTSTPVSRSSGRDKTQDSKTSPKRNAGLSSSYVSRKQQNQPAAKKGGGGLSYTSRKTESVTPLKRSNTEPAKPAGSYQYKSRKAEKTQPKERIIVGSHNDAMDVAEGDEDLQADTRPPPTSNLDEMFDDDDDGEFEFSDDTKDEGGNDNDSDNEEKQESGAESHSAKEEEEEVKGEEQEQEQEDEQEEAQLFVEDPDEKEAGGEQAEEEVVEEVDDEGYTVTKRKPRPVTRPNAAKRKAVNKVAPAKVANKSNDGKKKTQSSLMSFFGKK
ncbi:uncharacterized protein LODBEIA_P27080 [Lodderomyces beijingensis]|uniref:DNA polymerase delta subunit 3 n=1 Tax=Lodderomyces beijingensis TaxID=1775926 RepID=A0ABP0ZK12_9ASCO